MEMQKRIDLQDAALQQLKNVLTEALSASPNTFKFPTTLPVPAFRELLFPIALMVPAISPPVTLNSEPSNLIVPLFTTLLSVIEVPEPDEVKVPSC